MFQLKYKCIVQLSFNNYEVYVFILILVFEKNHHAWIDSMPKNGQPQNNVDAV